MAPKRTSDDGYASGLHEPAPEVSRWARGPSRVPDLAFEFPDRCSEFPVHPGDLRPFAWRKSPIVALAYGPIP
jgi:hypothetical protein